MRIAIEGCCHGELDKIYETVVELEKLNNMKIDLLIICGDFQAVRNFDDLQAMAVPPKYQQLNTFYKYYNKEKMAPVLTIFIGGNHEASNYMQELPYGGWVAPNIFYMGYAGVIQIGGVRIGGISGIFKGHDFNRGHHEKPPYTDQTKRSVYHTRNLEVFRLKQISRHVDIFISHDWPLGIYHHGDTASLIKRKPFFREEIEANKLGSGPLADLLKQMKPSYWFAAHLHVKFAAHVEHQPGSDDEPPKTTKFLALDKCLPRRSFLQVLDVPHDEKEGLKIKLDPEWLTILQHTNHLLSLGHGNSFMPGPGCGQRYDFKVTDQEMKQILETFGGDLTLPENFVHTSPPIVGNPRMEAKRQKRPLMVQVNPQTTLLCTMLDITDPNAKFMGKTSQELLNESSIGLIGTEEENGDSGDDAVEDDSDDDEMPSTIDSSMDVSSSSRSFNVSSSWESFQTANETFDNSSRPASVTSTPSKAEIRTVAPQDIQVDDNDDELLSILSAQKKKNSESPSKQSRDISACDPDTSTSKSITNSCGSDSSRNVEKTDTRDEVDCISSCQRSSFSVGSDFKSSAQTKCEETDEVAAILLAQKSAKDRNCDTAKGGGDNLVTSCTVPSNQSFSSSVDPAPFSSSVDLLSPMKPERSSFGMSGLCLDSSSVPASLATSLSQSPSPNRKRDGSETESDSKPQDKSCESTPNSGSATKKLKRRNVSVYSEPVE